MALAVGVVFPESPKLEPDRERGMLEACAGGECRNGSGDPPPEQSERVDEALEQLDEARCVSADDRRRRPKPPSLEGGLGNPKDDTPNPIEFQVNFECCFCCCCC